MCFYSICTNLKFNFRFVQSLYKHMKINLFYSLMLSNGIER